MKRNWCIGIAILFAAGAGLAQANGRLAVLEDGETPIPARARPAHERLLLEIQEEGRATVADLASRLAQTDDPEQRASIQRQIVRAKQENRLRFLESLAQSAQERGDGTTATEAQRQIELLRNPPRPVVDPALRSLQKKAAPPKGAGQ